MEHTLISLIDSVKKSFRQVLENEKLGFLVKAEIVAVSIGTIFALPAIVGGLIVYGNYELLMADSYTPSTEGITMVPPVAVALLIVGAISLMAYIFVYANISLNVCINVAKGETGSIKKIVSYAFFKAFPMFLHVVIKIAILVVGYLLLIIPGIYLTVKFLFSEYALINENLGAIASLKRSFQLTKGLTMNLFLKMIVFIVVQLIIGFPVLFLLSIMANKSPMSILGFIYTMIISVMMAMWYLDALKQKQEPKSDTAEAVSPLNTDTPAQIG